MAPVCSSAKIVARALEPEKGPLTPRIIGYLVFFLFFFGLVIAALIVVARHTGRRVANNHVRSPSTSSRTRLVETLASNRVLLRYTPTSPMFAYFTAPFSAAAGRDNGNQGSLVPMQSTRQQDRRGRGVFVAGSPWNPTRG